MAGINNRVRNRLAVGLLSLAARPLIQKSAALLVMVVAGMSQALSATLSVQRNSSTGQWTLSVVNDSASKSMYTQVEDVTQAEFSWTSTGVSYNFQPNEVSQATTGYYPPNGQANAGHMYGWKLMTGATQIGGVQYFVINNGVLVQTDRQGNIVQTPKYADDNGASCHVWAETVSGVGYIHIQGVTLPAGVNAWYALWKTSGGYNMQTFTYPAQDNNDPGKGFAVTAGGTNSQYLKVQYTDASGSHTIFEGNVMLPDPGGTPTPSTVNTDSNVPTYNAPKGTDVTPTTNPGPIVQGTGGGGGGGGGGSVTVTGPVTVQGNGSGGAVNVTGTVSVNNQGFFSTTAPATPTVNATGNGTASGLQGSLGGVKSTVQGLFANISGITSKFAGGSGRPVDMAVLIGPVQILGHEYSWTVHTVPDTTTTEGAMLDVVRLVVRSLLGLGIAWELTVKMLARYESVQ